MGSDLKRITQAVRTFEYEKIESIFKDNLFRDVKASERIIEIIRVFMIKNL